MPLPKHTKIYLDYFGYDVNSWIACEVIGCNKQGIDINHLKCKGAGGSKLMDFPANLMAMCREHHQELGDRADKINFLIECHEHATGMTNVKEKINEVLKIRGIALIL